MNKRQRKKQFKQEYGMNPELYFAYTKRLEAVQKLTDYLRRMTEKHLANKNLLRNLTAMRKAGTRKKGTWKR